MKLFLSAVSVFSLCVGIGSCSDNGEVPTQTANDNGNNSISLSYALTSFPSAIQSITGTLTPLGGGAPITISFTIQNDSASANLTGLADGEYSLLVTAQDITGEQFEGESRFTLTSGETKHVLIILYPVEINDGTVDVSATVNVLYRKVNSRLTAAFPADPVNPLIGFKFGIPSHSGSPLQDTMIYFYADRSFYNKGRDPVTGDYFYHLTSIAYESYDTIYTSYFTDVDTWKDSLRTKPAILAHGWNYVDALMLFYGPHGEIGLAYQVWDLQNNTASAFTGNEAIEYLSKTGNTARSERISQKPKRH